MLQNIRSAGHALLKAWALSAQGDLKKTVKGLHLCIVLCTLRQGFAEVIAQLGNHFRENVIGAAVPENAVRADLGGVFIKHRLWILCHKNIEYSQSKKIIHIVKELMILSEADFR